MVPWMACVQFDRAKTSISKRVQRQQQKYVDSRSTQHPPVQCQ